MNLTEKLDMIKEYLRTISNDKVALAITLLNTKRTTNWKETPYLSFREFADKHIALSQASIYVYLKTAQLAEQNDFTNADSVNIVNAIGWERFKVGLTKIPDNEKLTVEQFIERYKNVNLNERVTYGKDETDLVDFKFLLPKNTAEILTNALLVRGMRITNKKRDNLSAAMAKLVNDLIKERD